MPTGVYLRTEYHIQRLKTRPPGFKGHVHSESTKIKISKSRIGIKPWNKGLTGIYCGSKGHFYGKKHTPETIEIIRAHSIKQMSDPVTRKKMSDAKKGYIVSAETIKKLKEVLPRGPKHHKWIHDRSKLAKHQIRNDFAYKNWRRQVWIRDKFVCKIANADCKGRIEAHHILGWSSHPELRYQVNNGITLCHAHHPRKRSEEARLSPYFQKIVAEMN
jgi:hypothetical protein